jgi:hypothetical protein
VPAQLWIVCAWQFDGQCWSRSVQVSLDAGSVPSCASFAVPENEITSPTRHVTDDVGVMIVGVGGVLLAEIVSGALSAAAPWLSVTRSLAVYVPGWVYVHDGFAAVESSKSPSPSRSHANEMVSPGSGSLDPEPSNCTVSGALPLVGVAVATAFGSRFEPR